MASTVWRGFVTFGLISIPVRLFRAARAERVSFRRLYKVNGAGARGSGARDEETDDEEPEETPSAAMKGRQNRPFLAPVPPKGTAAPPPVAEPEARLEPVRQASIRNESAEVLAPRDIVKGYEYEKNQYVAIDPEELKSLAPKTATEMEIQEFVKLDEIDPVYFETSYYLVPEEAGEKAYALLYRSLQVAGLVAVAQFAMHSREHVVIVRPGKKGLIAHTMFFSSEVRGDEEFRADVTAVNPKELTLAQTLIQSLSASFEPEKYKDNYRAKVEELIARKVAGQPTPEPARVSRSAPVVDITEALQRSLAALKKPAASDQATRTTDREAPAKKTRSAAKR